MHAPHADPAAGNCGNNDALTQCPTAVAEPATPSQYQFQSLIRIQRSGATTSVPLTVPYPALSAECSDQFQVGYLLPIPAGAAVGPQGRQHGRAGAHAARAAACGCRNH